MEQRNGRTNGMQALVIDEAVAAREQVFMAMLEKTGMKHLVRSKNMSFTDLTMLLDTHGLQGEQVLYIVANVECWRQAEEQRIATLPYALSTDASFPGAWMVAEGLEDVDPDFLQKAYERAHHLPWTILETERCYLRELTLDDMDDLFRIYAGEGICDYMEPLYERTKEEEYQRAYIEHMYRYYGYGMWLVCRKRDDRIIGRAGLEHRDYHDQTELEMGYMIAKEEQNKGYATEVCEALVEYAGSHLDFPRINCLIEEGNAASIHMMDKLGFWWVENMELNGKQMQRFTR